VGVKNQSRGRISILVTAALFASALVVPGGHPPWPPPKHTAEYRQANMVFLRFQEALAGGRWGEALGMCSDRVRRKAAEWPSAGEFVRETIPVEILLAQDFGYWTIRGSDFFGLLVPLSEPGAQPVIQWHWAIYATNESWVVDYPPVKVDEFVARKKAAIAERDEKLREIRARVTPQAKACQTRLSAVSERFVAGSPMLLKVELANQGEKTVHFMNEGVAFAPLVVMDEQKQVLKPTEVAMQIGVGRGEVVPGAVVVLADKIDLGLHYTIKKSGKYFVQFSGANLEIGEPVPLEDWGSFGENEPLSIGGFVAVTNRVGSNLVEIEVAAAQK
jgi:hypothetical protein